MVQMYSGVYKWVNNTGVCKQYFFRTSFTASNIRMSFCKNKHCIIWITHCITQCCNDQLIQSLDFFSVSKDDRLDVSREAA